MSRASSLFRLQELDLELGRSHDRIGAIKVELADEEALRTAQSAVDHAEEALKEARSANLAADHAVAAQQEKIQSTEQALYGGSVTNPKELQDLQMESESLKRYLEVLEERLLEAMLVLEEAQSQADSARHTFDNVQADNIQSTASLRGELATLEADVERLSHEREVALGDVDPDDLEEYARLRERLGEHAVVLMHGGSCSACGVDLAHSQQQEVRNNEIPFTCPQCGRILYAG